MASKSLNVVEHEAGRFNELLVLLMKNNKVRGDYNIMFKFAMKLIMNLLLFE